MLQERMSGWAGVDQLADAPAAEKEDALAALERVKKEHQEALRAKARKKENKIPDLAKDVLDMAEGNERLVKDVDPERKFLYSGDEKLEGEISTKTDLADKFADELDKIKRKTALLFLKIEEVQEIDPDSEAIKQAVEKARGEIADLKRQVTEKTGKQKQLKAEISKLEKELKKVRKIKTVQLINSSDSQAFALKSILEAKRMQGEPLSKEEKEELNKGIEFEYTQRLFKGHKEGLKKYDERLAAEVKKFTEAKLVEIASFRSELIPRAMQLYVFTDRNTPDGKKFISEMEAAIKKAGQLRNEVFIFNNKNRQAKAKIEADKLLQPYIAEVLRLKKEVAGIRNEISNYVYNLRNSSIKLGGGKYHSVGQTFGSSWGLFSTHEPEQEAEDNRFKVIEAADDLYNVIDFNQTILDFNDMLYHLGVLDKGMVGKYKEE